MATDLQQISGISALGKNEQNVAEAELQAQSSQYLNGSSDTTLNYDKYKEVKNVPSQQGQDNLSSVQPNSETQLQNPQLHNQEIWKIRNQKENQEVVKATKSLSEMDLQDDELVENIHSGEYFPVKTILNTYQHTQEENPPTEKQNKSPSMESHKPHYQNGKYESQNGHTKVQNGSIQLESEGQSSQQISPEDSLTTFLSGGKQKNGGNQKPQGLSEIKEGKQENSQNQVQIQSYPVHISLIDGQQSPDTKTPTEPGDGKQYEEPAAGKISQLEEEDSQVKNQNPQEQSIDPQVQSSESQNLSNKKGDTVQQGDKDLLGVKETSSLSDVQDDSETKLNINAGEFHPNPESEASLVAGIGNSKKLEKTDDTQVSTSGSRVKYDMHQLLEVRKEMENLLGDKFPLPKGLTVQEFNKQLQFLQLIPIVYHDRNNNRQQNNGYSQNPRQHIPNYNPRIKKNFSRNNSQNYLQNYNLENQYRGGPRRLEQQKIVIQYPQKENNYIQQRNAANIQLHGVDNVQSSQGLPQNEYSNQIDIQTGTDTSQFKSPIPPNKAKQLDKRFSGKSPMQRQQQQQQQLQVNLQNGEQQGAQVDSAKVVVPKLYFERILQWKRDDLWIYLDPKGRPQGPFSSAKLLQWFKSGKFFNETLKVRPYAYEQQEYFDLKDMIELWKGTN